MSLDNRFTRVKKQRVMKLLRPDSSQCVLDIGCAVGTMMVMLASHVRKIMGFDFIGLTVSYARKQFRAINPDKPFCGFCADTQMLPLKNNAFDGATAVDFTEHIDDTVFELMLSETYRVLKPGAALVIYTPNPTHLFEWMMKHNIILKENTAHIALRPMRQYITMLRDHGFAIREAYFEPTHIPLIRLIERMVMPVPLIGALARRRICIRAVKPAA
ncbi:MAG: methyltransferase domain-containing protein [Chitinivibrionales bacterium]|nr:methyltransferase domain-containing protein [Chitinivibrionales bacterium]